MSVHDTIIRCLLENGRARVVAATTTQTVREIARRHDARGVAAVALGRAVTAGLTLATLTKDEEQVTLQVLGDGPLGGVTVDARSSGRVRAYLKHPGAVPQSGEFGSVRVSLAEAVGTKGVVSVIRDLGLAQNYAGQTALKTGEIDSDVENYLVKSEQIDSVLRCDTLVDREGEVVASAGLLVQTPGGRRGLGRIHSPDIGRATIGSDAERSRRRVGRRDSRAPVACADVREPTDT